MTAPITPEEATVLLLSLRVALACVALSLLPALALAWLLARRDFPGKIALEGVVHLPLVLPPVVTGYLLLVLFSPRAPLGRLLAAAGLEVAFTWRAAALASAVVGFPLMVRAMRLGIEAVDPGLEEASATLGAPPARTFLRVTLPLALPGVISGALLAFARSLGEFGATIVFAGNVAGESRTLPLAIFTALQLPGGEGRAARLVALSIALSLSALFAGEVLARRLRRRVGR